MTFITRSVRGRRDIHNYSMRNILVFYACTWQLNLGASPSCLCLVYFIKHSVSCYIYYVLANTEYTHNNCNDLYLPSQEESAFDLSQSPTHSLTPEEESCLIFAITV